MQQPTSLLTSSPSSPSSSPFCSSFSSLPRSFLVLRNPCRSAIAYPLSAQIPLNSSPFRGQTLHPLHSTAVREIAETSKDETKFIEIGYITNVHGIQGDLCIKPTTGFPELRFGKPGKRWLKERILGKESIREVELVEGRDHSGKKSWIISFRDIDTVEKAKQLVGSSLLVKEEDRPVLEDGEFYTPDLVGMRVLLKDTGEPVGTVVNVVNSGASDLLQVMLKSSEETPGEAGSSESETRVSGPLVWVPFVEDIVPDVDVQRREMHITPPEGLLGLNVRSDVRSKKERRQLEWKKKLKARQRVIAAKKKLSEMEQKHVFDGLRYGDKAQKSLLADQIVGINLKMFQLAMKSIETKTKRFDMPEFVGANSAKLLKYPSKDSEELPATFGTESKNVTAEFQQKGLDIISGGKAATILVVDDKNHTEKSFESDLCESGSSKISPSKHHVEALLLDNKRFTTVTEEERLSLPFIMISPANEIQSFRELFLDYDYFALDSEKVWFFEEERLPVVSELVGEHKKHEILLKTPWEILQSPVGYGGIFSLLSSNDILDNLAEIGVEYVQVCSLSDETPNILDPIFLGSVESRGADIGIKVLKNNKDYEENIDMIFSMRFLKKMVTQINKLPFYAVPKQNSYIKLVDKEWVDFVASSANSYEFRCSIYSAINFCSPDKVCLMEVSG